MNMLAAPIDGYVALIAGACEGGRSLDDLPVPGIADIATAYAVQDRLFERRTAKEAVAAGWFASATNSSMREQLGLAEPYAARWRPGSMVEAPIPPLAVGALGVALELEVSFQMGADLPPRATPYAENEVLAAVAGVRPSVEVVISCFRDWINQKPLNLVAEGGTEQLLILGPLVADWRALPLAALAVSLRINGDVVAEGRSARVMEGPVSVLVWLANHAAERGEGLRAGQICNTGMCAPVHFAAPGQHAVAEFGPLGRVVLDTAGPVS